MLPLNHLPASTQIKDSLFNNQGLEQVKALGRDDDPRALKEVAKQFESIFIQQMLKSMRSANAAFSEDSYFNSNEMQFHQDMMDQQMSLELSKNGGMGLAEALYRQLAQAYGDKSPEKSRPDEIQPLQDPVKYQPASSLKAERRQPLDARGEFESPEDFIQQLMPYAKKAAALLNVQPGWLLAQAALETGWGQFVNRGSRGENSFNLFNIKADQRWQGERVKVNTTEYESGVARPVTAEFRRYQSYADSFSDYVNFLQSNSRYEKALASTDSAGEFLEALQSAGYATDPQYAEKIKRIMTSARLQDGEVDSLVRQGVSQSDLSDADQG
jgi:flagellar protein FlgJ